MAGGDVRRRRDRGAETSERNASDPSRVESIARVKADSRVSVSGRAPGGSARHGTRRSGRRGRPEDHIDALGHAPWAYALSANRSRLVQGCAPNIPYRKIANFTPYLDGIGVYRDAMTALPKVLSDRGWVFRFRMSAMACCATTRAALGCSFTARIAARWRSKSSMVRMHSSMTPERPRIAAWAPASWRSNSAIRCPRACHESGRNVCCSLIRVHPLAAEEPPCHPDCTTWATTGRQWSKARRAQCCCCFSSNVIPPFVGGMCSRTIRGAHRACQIISPFSTDSGGNPSKMMTRSSGATSRLHLRHFNTTTPITLSMTRVERDETRRYLAREPG
jgi:hypothetical protein